MHTAENDIKAVSLWNTGVSASFHIRCKLPKFVDGYSMAVRFVLQTRNGMSSRQKTRCSWYSRQQEVAAAVTAAGGVLLQIYRYPGRGVYTAAA